MKGLVQGLVRSYRRFAADSRGNIAILLALSGVAVIGTGGAGIDLGRSYFARQQLAEVATLACQYAARPGIIDDDASNYTGSNGASTYSSKVTTFISTSLQSEKFPYAQTGPGFTSTQGRAANVTLTATVPTVFMQIVHVPQINVSATSHCYDTPSNINQSVPSGASNTLVFEGFENTLGNASCATNFCWVLANGTVGSPSSPSSSFPTTSGYTGLNGSAWYVMGYCLEIDTVGVIKSTVAQGTHSAELDCDNGSGTAGNSSISSQVYMPAGSYELRWSYVSRVDYPNYDPTYICGSAAADLSWANDANPSGGPDPTAVRTNQINVYLDEVNGSAAPTHKTIDGTETLAGSNLIDMCVYAQNWVQRSVTISVTTPAYYWLSFAADGQNDSYGGQIDDIMLCPVSCSGAVSVNYPSTWPDTVLYEDTFASPTYSANFDNWFTNADMNADYGTSGAASGWPNQAQSGWATAPYNKMEYEIGNAAKGTQSVSLDLHGTATSDNRAISRPFLLDPGYYEVNYDYISDAVFTAPTTVGCTADPTAAQAANYTITGSGPATIRNHSGGPATYNKDTSIVGVFMNHALMASTPVMGAALGAQTTFDNPDGTVTTTPKVSPYAVTFSSYSPTQANPLLDVCAYASAWQPRTAYIEITKPAYYWLTLAALGSADQIGGSIDDVKVTGLGDLSMTGAPINATVIPVPNPQPSSSTNYTGFSIVADPPTFPAPAP